VQLPDSNPIPLTTAIFNNDTSSTVFMLFFVVFFKQSCATNFCSFNKLIALKATKRKEENSRIMIEPKAEKMLKKKNMKK
jgi:hypothetical protein